MVASFPLVAFTIGSYGSISSIGIYGGKRSDTKGVLVGNGNRGVNVFIFKYACLRSVSICTYLTRGAYRLTSRTQFVFVEDGSSTTFQFGICARIIGEGSFHFFPIRGKTYGAVYAFVNVGDRHSHVNRMVSFFYLSFPCLRVPFFHSVSYVCGVGHLLGGKNWGSFRSDHNRQNNFYFDRFAYVFCASAKGTSIDRVGAGVSRTFTRVRVELSGNRHNSYSK